MSPMIVRQTIAPLCAAAVLGLALAWRSSGLPTPGRASMYVALGTAMLLASAGALAPRLTLPLADRPSVRHGTVIVRLRWFEPIKALIGMMLMLTAMAFCGVTGDVPGPRGSSSLTWAVWLFLVTWVSTYVLIRQPWRRELRLSEDGLSLRDGVDTETISWDRLVSIDEAHPEPAHVSSRRLRAAHAALTMRVRPSPRKTGSTRHEAQLHSRFAVGGMTVRPGVLVAAVRHLRDHPADRALLADRDTAERLFARVNGPDVRSR